MISLKLKSFVASCTLMVSVASLQAVSIDGEILFLGGFTAIDSGGSATSLGDATGLSFDLAVVIAASGDYVGTAGRQASITSFQFDPVLNPTTVDPLWSVTSWSGDTYSFTLNTIYIDAHTDNVLRLSGEGMLHADGYDDTLGTWSFLGGGESRLVFIAYGDAIDSGGGGAPVADGGSTMLMLGFALLGMGYLGTREGQRMMR